MNLGYFDGRFEPLVLPYLHEALFFGRVCFTQDGSELAGGRNSRGDDLGRHVLRSRCDDGEGAVRPVWLDEERLACRAVGIAYVVLR